MYNKEILKPGGKVRFLRFEPKKTWIKAKVITPDSLRWNWNRKQY